LNFLEFGAPSDGHTVIVVPVLTFGETRRNRLTNAYRLHSLGAFFALIVLGAFGLFWLRSGRKIENPRLWLRFSAVFLGLGLVAFVEGLVLSPQGFGWFILVVGITLYLGWKFAPKLLGGSRMNV